MALSAPTHLAYATDESSAGVTTKAFASTSPASDCLLIVVGKADSASNSADAISSISTTLSNVGAWTIIENYTTDIYGSQNNFIAYAKVTGAPGSGTVTVNWSGLPQDAITMELLYVTGHDTTTPVVHHDEFAGNWAVDPAAGTLANTPTSTSLILVLCGVADSTGGAATITPASGFTELGQQLVTNTTWNFELEIETQYRLTGTGTAVGASTLGMSSGGAEPGWSLMAIEIAEASSTVTGTVAVTLTAATSTAAGSSVTGTSTQALANFTSTSTGVVQVTGTSARTLDNFTSTATGDTPVVTNPNKVPNDTSLVLGDLLAYDGGVGVRASSVEGPVIVALSTATTVSGTAAVTLAAFTSTASGSQVTGTVARTLADFTSSASGAYGSDILNDDFPGSAIDPLKWVVYDRLADQVNSEVNAVIPANVRVSGGDLLIDSKFEDVVAGDTTTGAPNPRTVHYTSGQVSQRIGSFLYGSVRVRAKIPGGDGTWPCIWMLGYEWQASQPFTANVSGADWPNGGWWEADIAEFLSGHRTQVNNALHFVTANRGGSGEKSLGFDATTQFAVYRLDWTPTSMTWYVDDETGGGFVQTLQITGTAGTDIPDTPGYLIIHTAIGGAGGTPVSGTYPVTMEVDYAQIVRTADSIDQPMGYVYVTLADATSTASGTHSVTGTSAQSLAAFTSTASGSSVTGTSATTNAAFTSSATGNFGSDVTGTVAVTLADLTSSASGSTVTGTSTQTLAAFTSTASGSGVTGTSSTTNAAFTSSATGAHTVTGTSAQTLADYVSAAGGSSTAGTVAATLAAFTSTATGTYGDVADPYPATVTIRDMGHMVTVANLGHTSTVRDRYHTATGREQH